MKDATNPRIVLVEGLTRAGKSTLLNCILADKTTYNGTPKLTEPFVAKGGIRGVTTDFQYYTIKKRELCHRNNINYDGDECDYIFIDSERIGDITNIS